MLVTSDLYIRNYIQTNAMALLEENYDVFYLFSNKVTKTEFAAGKRFKTFETDNGETAKHHSLLNVLSWRWRRKSKSFRFRIHRVFGLKLVVPPEFGFLRKSRRVVGTCMVWLKNNLLLRFLGNPLIFPVYFHFKKKSFRNNVQLLGLIRDLKPSLALFPCSAFDPEGSDLVDICAKEKIATLFLIDNWDNLSSKTILWTKPDYLAVWGEQSRRHAVEIQDFEPQRVILIGTPRYEAYFETRDKPLSSHFDFPYILFVGTVLPFDEIGALTILNKAMLENPKVFGDARIVYRPHPWRLSKEILEEGSLEKVVIDPQVREAYLNKDNSASFQPSLEYYPSLLKNAGLIIGGLTSMIIEAMIYRKPFLTIVYDDGVNMTSQHNALKWYTHFEGLETVPSVFLCREKADFSGMFIRTWTERNRDLGESVEKSRQYYLFSDGRPYRDRLLDACRMILGKDGKNKTAKTEV